MSGAWEQKAAKQVLVGVLHTEMVSTAWALSLRELQVPGRIQVVAGQPYDMSRNTICSIALQQGYEWVFMLDSDVCAPPDTIHRLLSHKRPFISGVYHRRSPPHGIPVMMKPVGSWLTRYPANSLIEVDVVGSGCLLIHRSILERLPPQRPGKPWFDWRVDMAGHMPREECLSEDFTFCVAVKRQLGIPTMVDTSVQCRHIGLAEATMGALNPCTA